MKIIMDTDSTTAPYDNITSVVASSSDANFPVANLRDDFTTNLWRAASGTSATLTAQVSKGKGLALYNTNATSITVLAGSGETYVNESGYVNETGHAYAADTVTVAAAEVLPGIWGRIWVDYTEILVPHVLTITLTAAAVPYAGIIRAGMVQTFKDPTREHEEGSEDLSIEKELNNGADYFRKRNVIRTFDNLSMIETRPNAWLFKHGIFDKVGPQPLAIRLFDGVNVDDAQFNVFAKRINPPKLTHLSSTLSRISFNLREGI